MVRKLTVLEREILSGDEVRVFARMMKATLGPELVKEGRRLGLSVEEDLRFGSIAGQCRLAREMRNLSIKDAATALRVAQYRLRYIEESSIKNIDGAILVRYLDFLGLNAWFRRWKARNPRFAKKLGVVRPAKK